MMILQDLHRDVLFAHSLQYPERAPTFLSCCRLILGSRGIMVIAAHRVANLYHQRRPSRFKSLWFMLVVHLGIYLSCVLAKCFILPSTCFEGGVYLSDRGHIILGAWSVGSGTLIHDCVTIGRNLKNKGIPVIGQNVWIGPCCLVTGEITIGDGVTILPGTVLSKSLPPRVVVRGNPARIIKRDYDNFELRSSVTTDVEQFLNKSFNYENQDVQ